METGRQRPLSAAVARTRGVAALWLGCAVACGCDGAGTHALGTIRLALEASSCQDHCVVSVQAQPFRSREDALGIGPPSEPTACGDPLLLRDLPVGLQVTVKAWASDGFDNRFVGWSEPITVASSHEVTATVALEATAPPRVLSLSPEPVVLPADGGGVPVRVQGEGFESGAGLSYVEAGGAPLPSEGWSESEVTITVSASNPTAMARVVACGAASAPTPLRTLPVTPGQREVDLGGACAQAQLVALDVALGGRAAAALSCDGGAGGALLPLTLAPGACALGVSAWPLDGAPQALALDAQGAAWVATGAALTRWDLDSGAPATGEGSPSAATLSPQALALAPGAELTHITPWGGWLLALARAEDGNMTLVAGELAPADAPGDTQGAPGAPGAIILEPVPGVGAGLALRGLAASADELLLVAAPTGGAGAGATGRLARLGDPAAGFPEEWPLPDCPEPVAVATSPHATAGSGWAVVACAGSLPGVVAVPLGGAPADARRIALGLDAGQVPTSARLDGDGTVALVRAASSAATSVTAVDLVEGAPLRTWTVWGEGRAATEDAAGLVSFGSPDRVVLAGPGGEALTLLAPYGDADPCAALEGTR